MSSESEKEKISKNKGEKKGKRVRVDSSSDSGPEDREPVKKAKKGNGAVNKVKNDQDEEMLEIGNMKYVTVREFKGKTLIDIREYYNDKSTGKIRPGKKGISLNKEQYSNFKKILEEIDSKISG